jgi:hypothetical protein
LTSADPFFSIHDTDDPTVKTLKLDVHALALAAAATAAARGAGINSVHTLWPPAVARALSARVLPPRPGALLEQVRKGGIEV